MFQLKKRNDLHPQNNDDDGDADSLGKSQSAEHPLTID
jgi:hypothetical protein